MNRVCDIITQRTLTDFIEKAKNTRVLLIGDLCADIYWTCDMTKSVLSRETPYFPFPVVGERLSLGAGGNVANCLKTLGVKLTVAGVIHDDWRGACIRELINKSGISERCILTEAGGFTNTYIKPMQRGYAGDEVEAARIDFESEGISPQTERRLLEILECEAPSCDVLIVSDQFANGIMTDRVRARLRELAQNMKITVDSRMRITEYTGALLKPNEIECARAVGAALPSEFSIAEYKATAAALQNKTASKVAMTIGTHGTCIADGELHIVPAVKCEPPFDTVGAGDCFLSAFSVAYACGLPLTQCAAIGNMASAVTIKKLGITGTASPDELLGLYDGNPAVAD